jgi:hypothetical protein
VRSWAGTLRPSGCLQIGRVAIRQAGYTWLVHIFEQRHVFASTGCIQDAFRLQLFHPDMFHNRWICAWHKNLTILPSLCTLQ